MAQYFRRMWKRRTRSAYRKNQGYWGELKSGTYSNDTREGSKHPHKKGAKLTQVDEAYRRGFVTAYKAVKRVKNVPYSAFREGRKQGYRNGRRSSYRYRSYRRY